MLKRSGDASQAKVQGHHFDLHFHPGKWTAASTPTIQVLPWLPLLLTFLVTTPLTLSGPTGGVTSCARASCFCFG